MSNDMISLGDHANSRLVRSAKGNVVDVGRYELQVGASSADIQHTATFDVGRS